MIRIDMICKLTNKKKIVLAALIILLCLISTLGYLSYKKKEDAGFCRIAGKRLSDDELYQATMLYIVDYFQEARKKELSSDHYYCSKPANCRIWMIKAPLSTEQIKDKMTQSWNKSMSEIIEIFEMKPVDKDFILKNLQQNRNGFTLVHNIHGDAIFEPYDCCEIVSVDEVARLKALYQNDYQKLVYDTNLKFVKPENQSIGRRYLRYKRFYSGISAQFNTGVHDGLIGVFDFESLKNVSGSQDSYFPLSNCGEILSN